MSSDPLEDPKRSSLARMKAIGERLRRAREERGLTILETASHTGLTKGFVSQVELGKTSPRPWRRSPQSAMCLICRFPRFFEPPALQLIRANSRDRANFLGEGVSDTVLTPWGYGGVQVIETIVLPGGGSDQKPYRLPLLQEFVTVLAGRLRIVIEDTELELTEGDSLTFRASLPHTWRNPSEQEEARILWVLTPHAL